MQREPDELPPSAATVLDTVSAIVRAEARSAFTRGQSTVRLYPVDGWAELPQRPVVSVLSVHQDEHQDQGAELPAGSWWLVRDRVFVGSAGPVLVTYEHGYATVPGDVRAVVLSAASRVLSNPRDLRQESVGAVSVTYSAETVGPGLSPADRDLLARYRRRAAVVRLR
ncbi:hypothetical protein [Streptomyces harbinensis]